MGGIKLQLRWKNTVEKQWTKNPENSTPPLALWGFVWSWASHFCVSSLVKGEYQYLSYYFRTDLSLQMTKL